MELDRRCQCKSNKCLIGFYPCENDMTQEDLLCDDCRNNLIIGFDGGTVVTTIRREHCHRCEGTW